MLALCNCRGLFICSNYFFNRVESFRCYINSKAEDGRALGGYVFRVLISPNISIIIPGKSVSVPDA